VPTSALAAEKDGGSLYGPTGFALDDFRTINKFSYFDYQRDRVFARTGRHRKNAIVKTNRKIPAPNKIVTLRAARCPICHSKELKGLSQTVHEVADLRFMPAGGIKRWKTRYVTWRYCCTQCGSRFIPAAFLRLRKLPRYGRGLISWCIYQLLIGGQNLNRVHRSLLDLFGLPIPKTSVYLFKRAVASYFKLGYENILRDLLSGDLINIDETTINLQKDKGYVWVLASTNSVYFFYRKSREGSFLADMLQKFKGVLVSDFYTAYDSLDMPQQRCLIHLMRDMNEDLLKHPFDDELKSIASRFSCLLKAIVDTIDRYGLRKRHLNKHRPHAERFSDWVVARDFGSEVAKNYARRIAKYRNHLFAFLACDGIPRNNNNAEHAIKSFAKFRRFSNGTVTEDTVKDYLVILSVCLTCECRGIEFLKVLRGGTKGNFGFGPKRFTPLRLRPPREVAEPKPGLGIIPAEGTSLDEGYGNSRVITLNKLLPKMCDGLGRAFGGFRYRAELAADLWPVQVDPTQLECMMMTIADYIRKETRRRTITLSARNIRFVKPEPAIGLTGGYVALSLSDSGHIEQLRPPAREAVIPAGLGTDVSLDQVWIRAKGFGGTATVRSVRTGRNAVAIIVTAYIPQYSARSNDRFNLSAAGLLAAQ
jgi:Transposase IS66 family